MARTPCLAWLLLSLLKSNRVLASRYRHIVEEQPQGGSQAPSVFGCTGDSFPATKQGPLQGLAGAQSEGNAYVRLVPRLRESDDIHRTTVVDSLSLSGRATLADDATARAVTLDGGLLGLRIGRVNRWRGVFHRELGEFLAECAGAVAIALVLCRRRMQV
mmetsp:Transcript_989/g.3321  ORF Transcript_989/g.3321 Transcript_989/m.3321 type:complete len:160 (+) Transcript_989:65-544(+)